MPDTYPEYGAPIPIAISVLATLTPICLANKARCKLILVNDSDTIIYVHYLDQGVVNSGIRLNANGGTMVDEPDTLGKMWKGAVYAVAAAAGGKILSGYEMLG